MIEVMLEVMIQVIIQAMIQVKTQMTMIQVTSTGPYYATFSVSSTFSGSGTSSTVLSVGLDRRDPSHGVFSLSDPAPPFIGVPLPTTRPSIERENPVIVFLKLIFISAVTSGFSAGWTAAAAAPDEPPEVSSSTSVISSKVIGCVL